MTGMYLVPPTGLQLVTDERNEMIAKHHNTIEADVRFNSVSESNCPYTMPLVMGAVNLLDPYYKRTPAHWSPKIIEHMDEKPYKEKLITAAALLVAEIDRLIYIETHI
jgi:hypothetical protein